MGDDVANNGTDTPGKPEGARRQITLVFVDIVGSSALAAQTDAEDLGAWLEAYYHRTRDIVEARGGVVTEYLGDGVVACFGLTSADELTAPRAVDAALAMIAPLEAPDGWGKPLELRGGVATGEVVTRPTESGMPPAVGAVTTLACRIQEWAEPGQVLISEATNALLRGGFETKAMPAKTLKGFAEPQVLYRLSDGTAGEPPQRATAGRKPGAFVGRRKELDLISTAAKPCLIVGEAGLGKSALAGEATATQNVGIWLWADGLRDHSSHYPFKVWLRSLIETEALDIAGLQGAFPGLTPDAIKSLALVLGLPEGQQLLTEKSNLALKGEIERALVDAVFAKIPEDAALVVEDLHWLDAASFGVLQLLLSDDRAQTCRIILTSREDTKIGTYLSEFDIQMIALGPLDPGEANAMVAALADGALDDADLGWLVETSGGIPLFLEQLFKRGSRTSQKVPGTLMDLLAERIDGAGPAKGLLQYAAIMGRRFRRDVLAALIGDSASLDTHLGIAVGQGVLEKMGPSEWGFSHALLHQAAYHGILRRTREAHHAQLAELLKSQFPDIAARDPALVAQHHARARQFAPAILSYLEASQQALYQGAMADAESHTRAAIDLCDSAPPDFDTTDLEIASYTSLGSILMQYQGFAAPQVREAFETVQSLAMAAGRPSHNSAPALFGSFSHAIISGDLTRSEAFCDLLDGMSGNRSNEVDMSEVQLAALTTKNCKCFYAGSFAEQFEHIEQIRSQYELARHGGMIIRYGMDVFAAAQMFEPVARAIVGQSDAVSGLIEETDAHQGLLNIPVMLPYALIWGAVPLSYAGHLDRARARLARGIEAADEQGAVFWQVLGRVWQAIIEPERLRSDEGRAALRGSLDTLAAIGSGIGRSYFEAHYARALSEAGQSAEAVQLSAEAVKDCAASRLLCWYPEILRLHALNCDAAGQPDVAAQARQTGLEAARAQGAQLWELRLLLDMPASTDRNAALEKLVVGLDQATSLPELARAQDMLART